MQMNAGQWIPPRAFWCSIFHPAQTSAGILEQSPRFLILFRETRQSQLNSLQDSAVLAAVALLRGHDDAGFG
jgi:hypothetical protein